MAGCRGCEICVKRLYLNDRLILGHVWKAERQTKSAKMNFRQWSSKALTESSAEPTGNTFHLGIKMQADVMNSDE